MSTPAIRALTPILLLSYPLSVHLGVLYHQLWPALLVLLILLLAPLWRNHSQARYWAALTGAVLVYAAAAFTPLEELHILYLIPPAVIGFYWVIFARSLLPGQTPLVTRIAGLMHESITPRLYRYTRGVTWAWVAFLSGLLLEVVWLGLYAEPESWSLYTNFINYLFLIGFFLLELGFRRIILAPSERLGLIAFLRAMTRIDLRGLSRQ